VNLPTIETNRLILKGFSPEDMNYIFDNLPKHEIMEMLGHRTEEDYLKEEYKHKNGYSSYNRSFLLFLLTEKESGKIIGRCGIHNWNKEDKRAEIGYIMHYEDYKNKGFMSEVVEPIIDYGFTELKINRLEAIVRVGNVPSIRLLEKNNFKKEGIMRKHTKVGDNYEDSILYAKLINEHEEERSAVL
jgi:ribosomal-protein-alanine N-acetyltransferase